MKIALYCRVSTELQESEHTIDSQIAELERWAKTNNHIVVDKYLDDGYSGTLLARPQLDRLRDDATRGIFESIVILAPDRLSRKYVYQEIVIEELKNKGIQTIFLNRPIAETPEDQLLLGVQGIIAEYERAKLLERTRRGRLHRVKSGHILGNIPPYGYKLVKKGESNTGFAYYLINEEEASIVRKIFSLLLENHMSTYGVICELNRLKINARHGKRWAKSSISKILRNETYTGTTFYNKHFGVPSTNGQQKYHRRKNTTFRLRPKAEWIPIPGIPEIIDQTTFLKAQIQLRTNAQLSDRNAKNNYLLKGLLKCSRDERSYYGVPMHGIPYYRCSGKSKIVSAVKCKSKSISAGIIEPFIWKIIVDLTNNPRLIVEQIKKRASLSLVNVSKLEEKIKDIDMLIEKTKNQENRLLKAFSEELIDSEQLREQNTRLQEKRNNLNADREILVKQKINTPLNISVQNAKKYISKFKSTLESLTFEKKQRIVRTLLKEIIINDRHLIIRGFIPVQAQNVALSPQLLTQRSSRSRKNTTGPNNSEYFAKSNI